MGTIRTDGVNASMALPMTDSGEPDLPAARRYAAWLASTGITGVTVNGDTGEGAHLTERERVEVVAAIKDELGDGLDVVSALFGVNTSSAVKHARELTSAGADGLLVFSPPAFGGEPLPAEVPVEYFKALSDVGTPLVAFSLGVHLGGVVFEPSTLKQILAVPNVVGLKEGSFNAAVYVASRDALRESGESVAFLSGCDVFIYESFLLGADGCLLGFAGLAPTLTRELLELVQAGRHAEAEELSRSKVDLLASVLYAPPARDSRARIKAGLVMLGVIDNETVRSPLPPVTSEERADIRAAMKTAGLL